MVLENLTQVGKIGLGVFVAGVVVFIVGFSVPYWLTYNSGTEVRIGLWEVCSGVYCSSTTSSSFKLLDRDGPPGWYRGTQALACLALIAIVADVIVRLLFICGKPKKFLLFSVLLDCVSSALAILAAVVFGSKVQDYYHPATKLHFGFAFDIIGGILLAGAAVCFLIEYCRHR
ncbi:hypothetical protein ACOMHN_011702 [Nucella lapillus]